MPIPGFTAEHTLYMSKQRYRSNNSYSGQGITAVSMAACPGVVFGMGQSVGDARFNNAARERLAFERARFDAQDKCPPGCTFNPIPIGGVPNLGVTRVLDTFVGRPIETIRIRGAFSCVSPPRPPSGFDTAVKVVAVVGLAALFVVALIDPVPGDEVAVGGTIIALL